MKIKVQFLFLILFYCFIIKAEDNKNKKEESWNITKPRVKTKNISFETSQGTWMSVDISPDGKTIIFDILGNIYSMPSSGGNAVPLKEGSAYECQPRFSPDGKHISYTSDLDGADNIWMMDTDGKNPKQITKENFRLCNNAVWKRNDFIICKKHFTGDRSLGAGEMWMYSIHGGTGIALTKKKNDQQDAGEPAVSPNGEYVYWSEDMTDGPSFQYNKNPYSGIYEIRRLDLKMGKITTLIAGPGGACRPVASHNGKKLAYIKRVGLESVLYILDLQSKNEYPLFKELDKDQQETWALFGVYPNFNFNSSNEYIFISGKGKIWKVEVSTGKYSEIPFKINFKQSISEAVKTTQSVNEYSFSPKMLRNITSSNDGKKIAFSSLGEIFVSTGFKNSEEQKNDSKGNIQNISNTKEIFEYFPCISPDGTEITYLEWNDSSLGKLVIKKLGGGEKKIISTVNSFYFSPKYSNDGKKIVFQKGGGTNFTGLDNGENTGIYIYDKSMNKNELVIEEGYNPYFSKDGNSIFFTTGGGKSKQFSRFDLKSRKTVQLYSATYGKDFTPSPDGKFFAFTDLFQGYIVTMPEITGMDASSGNSSLPQYKFTKDYGMNLHFIDSGKEIRWSNGNEVFTRKISDCFKFLNGKDSLLPLTEKGVKLEFKVQSEMDKSKVAFTNARIITANGAEVIENGIILVDNQLISQVGESSKITVPNGYKIYDLKGKSIIPGIVDVHAHMGQSYNGITPQQQWSYSANLAYGVTTTHDPSANTEIIFFNSELQKAGLLNAPRIYSTGSILYGADGDFKVTVNSLEDAMSHLRRLKSVGAFSVKSYNQPRRNQRQMIIKAADSLGMMVYPEGGSTLFHNLNQIMDGHTGIEHSIPVSPLYNDVIQLWKNSNVGYTPTLIVSYGGIWGENYWFQKTDVYKDKRLLKFYPRGTLEAMGRRTMHVRDDDFGHIKNAESVKKLYDAGVNIQLGAHGQIHGIGAHWEMWMFCQGGMKPIEAIQASTLMGAKYLGMDKEIGSIEKGKIADFIVLNSNPLENIQNSTDILYVVQSGKMYNENLDEVYPKQIKRKPFFFERKNSPQLFDWHEIFDSKCSCHAHN